MPIMQPQVMPTTFQTPAMPIMQPQVMPTTFQTPAMPIMQPQVMATTFQTPSMPIMQPQVMATTVQTPFMTPMGIASGIPVGTASGIPVGTASGIPVGTPMGFPQPQVSMTSYGPYGTTVTQPTQHRQCIACRNIFPAPLGIARCPFCQFINGSNVTMVTTGAAPFY